MKSKKKQGIDFVQTHEFVQQAQNVFFRLSSLENREKIVDGYTLALLRDSQLSIKGELITTLAQLAKCSDCRELRAFTLCLQKMHHQLYADVPRLTTQENALYLDRGIIPKVKNFPFDPVMHIQSLAQSSINHLRETLGISNAIPDTVFLEDVKATYVKHWGEIPCSQKYDFDCIYPLQYVLYVSNNKIKDPYFEVTEDICEFFRVAPSPLTEVKEIEVLTDTGQTMFAEGFLSGRKVKTTLTGLSLYLGCIKLDNRFFVRFMTESQFKSPHILHENINRCLMSDWKPTI